METIELSGEGMDRSPEQEYLLGVNERELERLKFQHTVWGPVTRRFLERLKVAPGWKCLDVGSGPGFVTMDLREMVGYHGEVAALEPSAFYRQRLASEVGHRGWKNVKILEGKAEDSELPGEQYDLIFSRWVMSFVPDPKRFLSRLSRALRPGGVIALEDYYYEGLSLYPRGGAFDRMADVVREYYRRGGGDPYVTGELPAIFRDQGLRLLEYSPVCLSGGPGSGVMEWGHRFFTLHMPEMIERGIVSREEGAAIIDDWHAHRKNPDALFFSPLVVDVAAQRP